VHGLVVVAGVVLLVSVMIHIAPGDPAMLLVGDSPVPREQLEQIRRDLGLDRPIAVQIVSNLVRFARGDLGSSLRTNRPVLSDLTRVIPSTFMLAVSGMFIGIAVGVPIGVLAATRRGEWVDSLATAFGVLGISLPTFWTGILAIALFSVQLGWFPTGGQGEVRMLVLPALTLGWFAAGALARILRSGMLEALSQDHINVARAKGLRERTVVLKHALRSALIPAVTLVTVQFGALLSGTVIVETVFARDGLGRFLVHGILQKDFPVVQGAVLVIAVIYTAINLFTDLVYLQLDPRLRYA